MDPFWQVVLASSVVSTVLSTVIALISKFFTDTRQNTAAAQRIAQALELYSRQCATEIAATSSALELAYQQGSYDPLKGRSCPPITIDLSNLDRLEPDWRDQVAAFPIMVQSKLHQLAKEWYYADEYFAFTEISMEAEAELGKTAFDLASALRRAYGLPTVHASNDCRDALKIFADQTKSQRVYEERNAANNASIESQMSAAAQVNNESKQSSGL